ncbi:MAG: GNAT family N-acetyltransferase [Candidatus Thorarchaeota archaeon]
MLMTRDFVIRQFTKDDIDSVVAINKSCLPENYPNQFFLGLHYHAPKAFFVAESGTDVFGYIMCRIERGISSYGHKPVKKGHIVSVAVSTDRRHRGAGTELIKAGMKGMIEYGATEFFLEVRKTNEAAISIYQTLGYDIKRSLKGYYRDGEDAYLMVKKHDPPVEDVEPDQ